MPISAAAYGFLKLVTELQTWIFTDLPSGLGFHSAPLWWPLPLLAAAGVLVGLTIRYLPGQGGESRAKGFKLGGVPSPIELPGRRRNRSLEDLDRAGQRLGGEPRAVTTTTDPQGVHLPAP